MGKVVALALLCAALLCAQYVPPGGSGGGSTPPGSPVNSVQGNCGGAFCGSANLITLNTAISTPVAPGVTTHGAAGTTTYGYEIVWQTATGYSVGGPEQQIVTGNATLDGTNYNIVNPGTCPSSPTPASGYYVFRSTTAGTPASTGLLGSGACGSPFNDTGLSGDSFLVPAYDSSVGVRSVNTLNVGNTVGTVETGDIKIPLSTLTPFKVLSFTSGLDAVPGFQERKGGIVQIQHTSSSGGTNNSDLEGLAVQAFLNGTGTANDGIKGLSVFSSTEFLGPIGYQYGQFFESRTNNGQFAGEGGLNMIGTYGAVSMNGASTADDIEAGYLTTEIFETSSVGTSYALRLGAPAVDPTASLANNVGLGIEDQSGLGSTTNYNLWSKGAASENLFEGKMIIAPHTPASSSEACTTGQFSDGNVAGTDYHFVCVATDTWKRVALSSF